MRFQFPLVLAVLMLACGCSGGGPLASNPSPSPLPAPAPSPSPSGTPSSTSVTVTFTDGTPVAVATQVGTGQFASAALQNNNLTLSLPQSTTTYSIAYVCPDFTVNNEFQIAFVIEAAVQDGTAYNVSCLSFLTTIPGSAQFDASQLPGTDGGYIFGKGGWAGGNLFTNGALTGSIGYDLPTGTYDVAAATTSGSQLTAVKILRDQTASAAINGGKPIVFTSSDQTTSQPFTVNNVPAGFAPVQSTQVRYQTANGLQIWLNFGPQSLYPAVPVSAAQTGDSYRYDVVYSDSQSRALGVAQTMNNGGGAVTFALPVPWTYAGPSPASLPTFAFDYSGFPALAEYAQIQWSLDPASLHGPFALVTVTATANFQHGGNSITVPNLANLPGFFGPAPSGTSISWVADVFGGTMPGFPIRPTLTASPKVFLPSVPANSLITFVENSGSYTQP